MPDARDPRSVIEAAEQAAAAGDYASAEQFLREAADLQEATLGPLHPDLANTLNNLGVVCEITDKPVEAEHCFRRAWGISSAVLQPDHPFVATSRKNLEDFCNARGKPVNLPAAPTVRESLPSFVAEDRGEAVAAPAEVPPEHQLSEHPQRVATWARPLAAGVLIAAGLYMAFIGGTAWFRSNDQVPSSPEDLSGSSPKEPNKTAPAAVAPIAFDPPQQSEVRTEDRVAVNPKTGAKSLTPTAPAAVKSDAKGGSPSQLPSVAAAQLCSDLSTAGAVNPSIDWRCVPADSPVDPGSLFFYTRLKSPTGTTVQHRWYRDDRLHRVVELPIRVNTAVGYRTYSRSTVDNQGTGDWRVELRTRDGVLLHEERFVVR
jgi:hypothetical protein